MLGTVAGAVVNKLYQATVEVTPLQDEGLRRMKALLKETQAAVFAVRTFDGVEHHFEADWFKHFVSNLKPVDRDGWR